MMCVIKNLFSAGVQDSEFRVQGPGFRVQGSGSRVQGSRFEHSGARGVKHSGLGVKNFRFQQLRWSIDHSELDSSELGVQHLS